MARTTGTKRVTMQDIARKTGYSINTVSHALRNKDDIARDTRDLIQKTAHEMGYMGNQIASSLRSGRTHTLAVILGNMSNPFYGIMADTIQDAAAARGYSLLIMCSRDQAEPERRMVEAAVARRADGILLFPTAQSLGTIERLRAIGVPLVLMSRTLGDGIADSVTADDDGGAFQATSHLIEHGRRRLAYLAQHRIVYGHDARLNGFMRACDAAGLPREDRRAYVYSDEAALHPDWHATLTDRLLRWQSEGVDGLFVFCDEQAWHVQAVIKQTPALRDWKPGIASFDNIQGTQYFPADLCSVDCGFAEMARQGLELLRARIHGDDRPPVNITCPVKLVCRGSC
ncbi:MAG: LacI family transcriptional regulator [Clostridiales bacterium]|nr:LacI family transcriptional regulator [Clostridiales bacterium]